MRNTNKKSTQKTSINTSIADNQMPIFLIGFMGCGKTTYGKALAQFRGASFFDLDEEIETYCGHKIPEIFAVGENIFRNIERTVLHRIVDENNNFVLACGGGTPCFFDNIDFINTVGISVYLKCTPAELAQNILQSNPNRPLIKGKSGNDLLEYIKTTLNNRKAFYERSKITLTAENHTSPRISENIDIFIKQQTK